MVTTGPPVFISGSDRRLGSGSERREFSVAVMKPSSGQSATRPVSASLGAKGIAGTWVRVDPDADGSHGITHAAADERR